MTTMKKKARVQATDDEMRAAIKAARARERAATKIKTVRYDRRGDSVVVMLSTGAALTVPRKRIAGFARAMPRALSDLSITPGGEGVWSDMVDDGVLLEQMLVLAAGEVTIGTIGARINAAKKSPARAAASRANGAKGGRPRKSAS